MTNVWQVSEGDLTPEAWAHRDALVQAHDLLPARGGRVRCSRCEVSVGLDDFMQASTTCRQLTLVATEEAP